jgi:hypothetical protein
VLIGWGFLYLARRVRNHEIQEPSQPDWAGGPGSTFSKSSITRTTAAILYVGVNAYIVIFTFVPPYTNADGTTRSVKGWLYAVVMVGITLVSFIYYILVVPTPWNNNRSIINYTGATASVEVNEGGAHHATYGFRQYIDIVFPEDGVGTGSGFAESEANDIFSSVDRPNGTSHQKLLVLVLWRH